MKGNPTTRRRELLHQSFTLNSGNLGHRIVRGAGYKFLGTGARIFLTVASTAILARLLEPSDFGYLAMATVVTELAALFGAFGFTNVLIQRKRINRLQLDTVFWATLGIGVLTALGVFIASFFARWIFGDGGIAPLLRALSVTFILNSLDAVPWIVMSRVLQFRVEFLVQIGTILTRSVVAATCALMGLGVWSLVLGSIAGCTANVIVNFVYVPYKPRFRFHARFLSSIWRTSGNYFGTGLLYYVNMNIDLLLIGRYLGAAPLGYYQNARSLTDEIRARIAMPIQHVLFPAFSSVHGDRSRSQDLVRRSGKMLAAVVTPIGFGVSANAHELVAVLYGSRWLEMSAVLSMFGLSAAIRASTAIASTLFTSSNQVGLALRYNIASTVLMILGVVIARPYGVNAVGAAVALTSLYSLITLNAGLKLIGLGWRALFEILGPAILASAVMWGAIEALRQAMSTWHPQPVMGLAIQVGTGALAYAIALHTCSRTYFHEFQVVLKKFVSRH